MKKIVTLGTLREDVVMAYDFSSPLQETEKNIDNLEKSVGGSVNNTSFYLASKDLETQVVMCSLYYADLVEIMRKKIHCTNYRISTTPNVLFQYPVSVIGIKNNGDKQLISYDPVVDDSLLIQLFNEESNDAELLYTSFYEVNQRNGLDLSFLFKKAMTSKKDVMVDLCPLLNRLSSDVVDNILTSVTILSGNESEFEVLKKIIGLENVKDIFTKYMNIKKVCMKRGENGAILFWSDDRKRVHEVQAVAVLNDVVKNTTGCGDVFNAVMIEGFINNRDFKEVLECAVRESGKIAEGGLPWI